MQSEKGNTARWEFCLENGAWRWRCFKPDEHAADASLFSRLFHALADAELHGFDRERDHWVVKHEGRATHFRPGKVAVNLPIDCEPC